MSAVSLAETIITLLAMVGIGWMLRATGLLAAEDAGPINRIIVYVGLPALIFQAVRPAELDPELAVIAGIAWLAFLAALAVSWGLMRLLRLPEPVAGGFVLDASLGNTGYIGYPVALALLGETGLVRAIFFDLFGTVAALLAIGLPIAARMGVAEGVAVRPLREIVTFPAAIALAVALLTRSVPIPEAVSAGLDTLANLVVPLIMISVGLSLQPRSVGRYVVPLGALSVVKLVLAPLVAFGAGRLLGLEPDVVRLVTLQAGMPAMMLTLVFGLRYRLDTDFIASAILVTTGLSAVTIPVLQLLPY